MMGRYGSRTTVVILAGMAILLIVGGVLLAALRRDRRSVPRTFYVSAEGSDEVPGTTRESPLKTIQKAVDQAHPGDTIELADGNYRQNFKSKRAGEASRPITIRGSRQVIVRGSGEGTRVVEINHSYLTVEGFTVDGLAGGGDGKDDFRDKLIYVIGTKRGEGVKGTRVTNMALRNAGGECLRLRYLAEDSEISYNNITNCGVHDFRFGAGGKNGEAIYIGTAPEQTDDGRNPDDRRDESRGNHIHHNTIITNGNECVDIKEGARDNVVEYNDCSGQQDPESGGFDARGDNNTFRFNYVHDNVGAGVRLGGDDEEDGINNTVRENTFLNNAEGAVKIMREPQGEICGNGVSGSQALGGDQDNVSRRYDVNGPC